MKKKNNFPEVSPALSAISETRALDCILTDAEISERSHTLAKALQVKAEILQELKEVKAGFKQRLEETETVIISCAAAINNGKETRDIECKVHLNEPKDGTKTIVRIDTGEEWQEPMQPEELQEEIQYEV